MEPPSKRQRLIDPPAPAQPTFYAPTPSNNDTNPTPARSAPLPTEHPSSHQQQQAPTHGNYKAYYTKRPTSSAELDPRLKLIPLEWIKGKSVLDVGCNAGLITVELAQEMGAARVVGVDIDEELVRLAGKHAELMWSRQAPQARIKEAAAALRLRSSRERDHDQTTVPHISSYDATSASSKSTTSSTYFPLSFPRIHGYLPFPPRELVTDYMEIPDTVPSSVKGKEKEKDTQYSRVGKVMPVEIRRFPENVRFKCADWAKEKIEGEGKGYDIIIAFSITKWIHLNTLNEGLLLFFSKAFKLLRPGGKLILEPQPFSSYPKSARLSDELKKNFEKLRDGEGEERGWRDEEGDFERVLLNVVGFEKRERLGEGTEGIKGFRRPIDVYYKREGSWM